MKITISFFVSKANGSCCEHDNKDEDQFEVLNRYELLDDCGKEIEFDLCEEIEEELKANISKRLKIRICNDISIVKNSLKLTGEKIFFSK